MKREWVLGAAFVALASAGCTGAVNNCTVLQSNFDTAIAIGPNETNGSTSWTDVAQSFYLATAINIDHIEVYLQAVLNPPSVTAINGTMVFSLIEDPLTTAPPTPTSPTGTTLAVGTLNMATVSQYGGWYRVDFGAPISLAYNQVYWITASSSLTQNSPYYVIWRSSSTDVYSNGIMQIQNSGTGAWQAATIFNEPTAKMDFAFRFGCPSS